VKLVPFAGPDLSRLYSKSAIVPIGSRNCNLSSKRGAPSIPQRRRPMIDPRRVKRTDRPKNGSSTRNRQILLPRVSQGLRPCPERQACWMNSSVSSKTSFLKARGSSPVRSFGMPWTKHSRDSPNRSIPRHPHSHFRGRCGTPCPRRSPCQRSLKEPSPE